MFLHKHDSFVLETEAIQSMSPYPDSMPLQLLYSALLEACYENKLVQGPSDCIELLSSNPNKVVVGLLPVDESEQNVNLSIQLILIESLCQEYDIPVVKVDKNQIKDLVSSTMTNSLYGTSLSKEAVEFISELDCCFIQSQGDDLGASEKKLMNLLHIIQDENNEHFYADYPK